MIKQYSVNVKDLLSKDENKLLREIIREDVLYSILRKTTDRGLMQPQQIIDVIRENYSYKLENFITPSIENEYNKLDQIVDNTLLRYSICKNFFDISYNEFKFINETDFKDVSFEDKELWEFIENIKDIGNGHFSIYANQQKNVQDRILKEFKQEYNKQITSGDMLKEANQDILEEYNLDNKYGVDIRECGLDFCFLVKDLSYAGRPKSSDMTYKDYYNVDEHHFPSDSKSLVSNNIFTTIGSDQTKIISSTHLLVGYNGLTELYDASSADLASDSTNGVMRTYLKTGKNVKHLCNPKELLKATGVLKDDNTPILKYNEIVDTKYDKNDQKIQPDYVIFAMSQNKNSKFSGYISERFEVACQAANEFKVPLVFMDLDKIAENEYDTVNKKLEEYKKNGNSQLLQDILGQIRMNRVTDYGVNLFTDKYLYDSIVDIYDSKNKDIFYEELVNMPNLKLDNFQWYIQMKINKCNSLKDNEEYSKIISAQDIDELKEYISDEENHKIDDVNDKLNKQKKKFFKTSKTKKEIFKLEEEKETIKHQIIGRIKEETMQELSNMGIRVDETENTLNDLVENTISHYNDILNIFEERQVSYEDVPSLVTIENHRNEKRSISRR